MKATLTFNLPDEEREFKDAVNGGNMSIAIFNIQQEIFRPARKHGYSDKIDNTHSGIDGKPIETQWTIKVVSPEEDEE
jgi:hypothetical protein